MGAPETSALIASNAATVENSRHASCGVGQLETGAADLIVSGTIERVGPASSEIEDDDVVDLPRVAFQFDKVSYARLRQLIDAVNSSGPPGLEAAPPPSPPPASLG